MIEKKYLNEKEVSRITGFKLPTLRNHRHMGIGIPYIKASVRAVRYDFDDVVQYMTARKINLSEK
jgi:hypothetical protein